MANLAPMPEIVPGQASLLQFGLSWTENGGRLLRNPPNSSIDLGNSFDRLVAASLSEMLGGIPIANANARSLTSPETDCVEVGPFRVIGGVRPQNFDVGYRPDGVRKAFDSKTLNDTASVRKNYQNMINDLATEATTVHTRFPYALVAFLIAVPEPCLIEPQRSALKGTLNRLTGRMTIEGPDHLAEVICLILWNPDTGEIHETIPEKGSSPSLRIEDFSNQLESIYRSRYQGLPPHSG